MPISPYFSTKDFTSEKSGWPPRFKNLKMRTIAMPIATMIAPRIKEDRIQEDLRTS
jgi:hypothetical protein